MTTNIYKAFVAFQKDAPSIEKNKTTKVRMKSGGEYSFDYADLSEILDKCRPILSKHGLAVTQILNETDKGTELNSMLVHESGETIESKVKLPPVHDPQAMGSMITYYRRYSIVALLGLVADEDDDGNSASEKSQSHTVTSRATNLASEKQIELIKKLCQETNTEINGSLLKSLTSQNASKWIEKLNVIKKSL